jgi:hypothetical protein
MTLHLGEDLHAGRIRPPYLMSLGPLLHLNIQPKTFCSMPHQTIIHGQCMFFFFFFGPPGSLLGSLC